MGRIKSHKVDFDYYGPLTYKQRQELLSELTPEQKDVLEKFKRYQISSELLTRVNREGGDFEFVGYDEFTDFDRHNPKASPLQCECGKHVKYLYYCVSRSNNKKYKFGINHLKQEAGIPAEIIREIKRGYNKIDLGIDEILRKVHDDELFPTGSYELCVKKGLLVRNFSKPKRNYLKRFYEVKLPLYDDDSAKIQKIVREYLIEEERKRQVKEERRAREQERQAEEIKRAARERKRRAEEREERKRAAKQKEKKDSLQRRTDRYNAQYQNWFPKLDDQKKISWRRKEVIYGRILHHHFFGLSAKGILDIKCMVQTLIVSTILDDGKLRIGEPLEKRSVALGKMRLLINEYQLNISDEMLTRSYDWFIKLFILNSVIIQTKECLLLNTDAAM